ncbi:MAG: GNAT family N-acetyltransferase [Candidatus Binatia bacterium]
MTFAIREARREDGPAIVGLIRALAEFEHLPGPSDEAAARLVEHGFGPHRYFESLVVEVDGVVVAYTIHFTTYSTFLMRPTLFLEDIFVHPRVRRRGIGTALMERLRAIAVERGCGRFEWTVLDWNAGAQAFYAKLGAKRLEAWRLCRVEV